MGRSAQLTSIDAVTTLAAALDSFRHDCLTALDELKMELRRAGQWVHEDRRLHWDNEVRRSWDGISEARLQLQQAMTIRRMGDHDPACVDEKKALERAKRRQALAEQKVEAVRHWAQTLDRALHDFEGAAAQLSNWLDSDVPQGLAALRQMSQKLEAYLAVQVVHESMPAAPAVRGEEPPGGTAGSPSSASPGGTAGLPSSASTGAEKDTVGQAGHHVRMVGGTPTSEPEPFPQAASEEDVAAGPPAQALPERTLTDGEATP